MRHVLVDRARRQQAQKRGGDAEILSLDTLGEAFEQEQATAEERSEMLAILDAALNQFEKEHGRASQCGSCGGSGSRARNNLGHEDAAIYKAQDGAFAGNHGDRVGGSREGGGAVPAA